MELELLLSKVSVIRLVSFCDYGFSLSARWCLLSVPTILLGYLLTWMWGVSSWLLQQSAATAPYLGGGGRGESLLKIISNLITWTTALSNSMKTKPCHVGPPKMGESWWRGLTERSPLEKNSKPLQYSCLENPINSMKRQNDRTLKEELHRSVGTQYATGDQWRNNSRNNSRKDGAKAKTIPSGGCDCGDRSKVQCCKEQ